jgi:hypothetical protein
MMSADSEQPRIGFIFPVPKLSSILGKDGIPTRLQLLIMQQELNANARTIVSTLDPVHGLLSLTVTPARYLELNNNIPFNIPVAPPPFPVYPPNPTQFQLVEIARVHALQVKAFTEYKYADAALLRLLRDATPENYLKELSDPEFEFSNVTTLQALTHLHAQYSTVTTEDFDQNKAQMEAQWNPPTPIQDLFTQLTDGQRFLTENDGPLMDLALARMGFNIILKTRLFESACSHWRQRPEPEKTFANFRTYFARQEVERRAKITAQAAGYHGANAATTAPPSEFALYAAKMSEEMAEMKKMFAAAVAASTAKPAPPTKPKGYCWTHGHTTNALHNSATCMYPAEGHKSKWEAAPITSVPPRATTVTTAIVTTTTVRPPSRPPDRQGWRQRMQWMQKVRIF